MNDSFNIKQTITRILQAPPGLERRSMHTRFFFWVTCLVFLLTLGLITFLTGTWFFAWPISAQLTALALFLLFEPHLEKRLSPVYRGSDTLTNLAEKSRDEWTQMATNAADQAKHRTVQTVQRLRPPPIIRGKPARPSKSTISVSPFDFPGVVLKDNGDIQIGLRTFPWTVPIASIAVNGITIQEHSDGTIQFSRDGITRRYRFDDHWTSAELDANERKRRQPWTLRAILAFLKNAVLLIIWIMLLPILWPFYVLYLIEWVKNRKRRHDPPALPRTVQDAQLARSYQSRLLASPRAVVPWGGLLLPVDRTLTHFALIGSTRSGKTINMRLLMQAAIPNALAQAETCFPAGRAVVFDPKSEFVPILCGMGLPADRIKMMNPFDRRCVPWDIAADTLAPSDADNVAAIFVPEVKGDKNEHFFTETSRTVVSSVIQALHHVKGTNWSLRDFILVCSDFERVETLLAACPETRHNLRHLKLNSDTYGNILASLQVIVKNFRVVAACWHHSTEQPLSINEWMSSNSVIVLGHDDTKSTTFSTLNRCLIHKISNVILAPTNKTDPEQDRTWLFLDEARDLGKLTGIRELLTRGAGKGCTVVLGFQSINGMKHVFGEHEASEIVGQCDNIGIFRFGNDHDTAKWAADLIGRHERTEFMRTESYSKYGGTSTGSNEQLQERYIIRPEALQEMPSTDRAHGLNGVFVSKTYGVIHASHYGVTGDMLFTRLLDREDPATPALLPRDSSEERLPAWSEEEEKRLASPRDDDPPEDWIYKLGRIG